MKHWFYLIFVGIIGFLLVPEGLSQTTAIPPSLDIYMEKYYTLFTGPGQEEVTWTEAHQKCEDIGQRLLYLQTDVRLKDLGEQTWKKFWPTEGINNTYWTSGLSYGNQRIWTTNDGKLIKLKANSWTPNSNVPSSISNSCVTWKPSLGWKLDKEDCESKHAYICQYDIKPTKEDKDTTLMPYRLKVCGVNNQVTVKP